VRGARKGCTDRAVLLALILAILQVALACRGRLEALATDKVELRRRKCPVSVPEHSVWILVYGSYWSYASRRSRHSPPADRGRSHRTSIADIRVKEGWCSHLSKCLFQEKTFVVDVVNDNGVPTSDHSSSVSGKSSRKSGTYTCFGRSFRHIAAWGVLSCTPSP